MSAKDLEDFIAVIESAEKMSVAASSSSMSYPSDIFNYAVATPVNRKLNNNNNNNGEVPRLWKHKRDSDFLGSSWGSTTSSTETVIEKSKSTSPNKQSIIEPLTSSSLRKSSSSSSSLSGSLTQKSSSSPVKASFSSPKKTSLTPNALIAMQSHSQFARVVAKELSPAQTPETNRKTMKSSSSSTSSGSPSKPKTSSSSKKSSSPLKSSSSSTSSISPQEVKKVLTETPSPPRSPPPQMTKLRRSSSILANQAKHEDDELSLSTPKIGNKSPLISPDQQGSKAIMPKKDSKSPSISQDEKSIDLSFKSPLSSEDITEDTPKKAKIRPKSAFVKQKTVVLKEDEEEEKPKTAISKPNEKEKPQQKKTPKRKKKPPQMALKMVDLRNYSKSLKLLGLDIPSNRRYEASKFAHQEYDIRTKSPTLKTRLKGRTQSVTDLREAIDSKPKISGDDFAKIHDPLKRAVFEEWYFKKVTLDLEKKREKEAQNEDELYKKEMDEVEKKEKSVKAYQEWLLNKKKVLLIEQKQKKAGLIKETKSEERLEKIRKAEKEWREKKRKEFEKLRKRNEKKLKKKEVEEEKLKEKKLSAEKQFQSWKEEKLKEFKKKIADEKETAIKLAEEKKEKAREKKEDAEAAFKAWKRKKEENGEKDPSIKSNGENEEEGRKEKIKAARKAYDDWLEYIEQREIEDKFAEEEKILRHLWRPPWYPS